VDIYTRNVPSAWTSEGGKAHLPHHVDKQFEQQLKVLVTMMKANGSMPDFAEVGEFRRYDLEVGYALQMVLEVGFDVVLDGEREAAQAQAERARMMVTSAARGSSKEAGHE